MTKKTYKTNNDMKNKAEFAVNILLEYAKQNGINGRDITDLSPLESWLILRLYNIEGQLTIPDVSSSCEWCGAKKENHNGLCTECGRFPSPSNFRSHWIK